MAARNLLASGMPVTRLHQRPAANVQTETALRAVPPRAAARADLADGARNGADAADGRYRRAPALLPILIGVVLVLWLVVSVAGWH